jgi:hypothetical protein
VLVQGWLSRLLWGLGAGDGGDQAHHSEQGPTRPALTTTRSRRTRRRVVVTRVSS